MAAVGVLLAAILRTSPDFLQPQCMGALAAASLLTRGAAFLIKPASRRDVGAAAGTAVSRPLPSGMPCVRWSFKGRQPQVAAGCRLSETPVAAVDPATDRTDGETQPVERRQPDAGAADSRLEVVVVGSGVIGLLTAAVVAASVRGRKRVRVYGTSASRDAEAPRISEIFELQSSVWSRLPEKLQDSLMQPGNFVEQWPWQPESPDNIGFPRNLDSQVVEDGLREFLQQSPYSEVVHFCPQPYMVEEHERVLDEGIHALVLTDGDAALRIRDEALSENFGPGKSFTNAEPETVLALAFDLADQELGVTMAEATCITLAQKRYSVSFSGERKGILGMRLAASELSDAELLMSTSSLKERKAVPLWSRVADGLKLFQIPEAAVSGISRQGSAFCTRTFHLSELTERWAPGASRGDEEEEGAPMEHPYAFLVGESADLVNVWPGRGLNASMRGAFMLADLLVELNQGVQSGWTVEESFFADYAQSVIELQAEECEVCGWQQMLPYGIPGALSRPIATHIANSLQQGGTADAKKKQRRVLDVVRDAHSRLREAGLPPRRRRELPTPEAICSRLTAAGLSPETWSVLDAAGAWVLDPRMTTGGEKHWRTLETQEEDEEEAEEESVKEADQAADSEPAEETVAPVSGDGAAPLIADAGHGEREKAEEVEGNVEKDIEKEEAVDARKLFNEGVRYLKGKNGPRHEPSAARCFYQAAKHGHKEATYALGVMLLNGQGVKQDKAKAAYWFTVAMQAGHAKAAYNLSVMYKYGDGVKPDAEKKEFYAQLAAEWGNKEVLKGDHDGFVVFGKGPWLDFDPQKMGADGVLREATAGNKFAQTRMGMMLANGEEVPQDKAKAAYWFMKAAVQGVAEAQYQISSQLLEGDGVEQDEDYGLRFLFEAAEAGHPEAQHNMGVKLFRGESGLDVDRQKACKWWAKAAEQDVPQSQNNLGWAMVIGEGVPQNLEGGRRLLQKAAGAGCQEAMQHLWSLERS